MKRTLLLLGVVLSSLFLSCGKQETGCQPKTPASEKADMVAYCTANGITYTEHPSGILYQIILPGNDPAPTSTSTISAVYTGKLLNGTQFDATATPRDFSLSGGLIEGWKIAIPLIKKSGRIKVVIPSALAYTCVGSSNGVIPPNSPIFFDITLTDVK
ncbi:FKBP-type peptidyl-prolyl cis-trans isomerase [Sediminibacterium goheungense]|uniref:Peptidyl-prolyl cis-trans isomerase n=1 Tax=Sediminibacterium goheungense TaxID=1086393 RepID=A0A4V6PSH0_9BACT|nr:FKBP-type peptidyl-prolyl cis-trans isomerase [Sediminibacterium goheungense]TDO25128.1 FKBP-type peptidyl-prolyl isomerase-like protein [Sediminibacterium goheungense]